MTDNKYSTKLSTSVYVLKEKEEYNPKQVGIIFTRRNRYCIFAFFLLIVVVINIDNGCIAASIEHFKNDSNFQSELTYFKIGVLGSISFLGNIIGKIIFDIYIYF